MSSAAESAPARDADVLVLGASFAGIEVVYQLHRMLADRPPRIVVVDREREHGYLPLQQERLVGALPPEQSCLRSAAYIESLPRARFVQGEIVGLSLEQRAVELADGRRITARTIVVALGSELAPPPGLPGGSRLFAHKRPSDFVALQAALDERLAGEGEPVPVVVVGGGITGVELAAELAALAGRGPGRWRAPKVTLVGSEARLVPNLRPNIAARVARILAAAGVDVRLSTRVTAVEPDAVELETAGARERVPCALAMWAGGIRPAPLLATLGLPTTAAGWLSVGPTLQCFARSTPTFPWLFACGDAVRIAGGAGEWPTMQRAIECLWQAKLVARNLVTLLAEPDGEGGVVPPLRPHRLRRGFAYGVSLGHRALVLWGRLCVDLPRINRWFRRWLMRQYFARYEPLPPPPS
ncbi:MAG: FAD-dependent oxidoreductase [Nannocystaceae bacterium]